MKILFRFGLTSAIGVLFGSQPASADSVSFTRITEGAIATDRQQSMAVAWGDYDGDGDLDVVFTSTGQGQFGSLLYRNAGTGAFERIVSAPLTTDPNHGLACAWADFDNDGDLDLFRSNWITLPSALYINNGGTFTRTPYVSDHRSMGVVWGDYDNDGHLDLFLPSGGFGRFASSLEHILYHNDNNGRLTRMQASDVGPIVSSPASGISAAWSDFNGDGLVDLFVTNYDRENFLYLNAPDHHFTSVTSGTLVEGSGASTSCALGDYDNDGDLDLFVADGLPLNPNALYRNDGGGSFSHLTSSAVTTDTAESLGAAWGDYDNDGWLDLFVANGETVQEDNFLYRNNGDGTFTRVLEGSVVNNGGASLGCAWGDYDNDGFLDLIVANGALRSSNGGSPNMPEENFLYHNDANNGNHWIKIKCVGTTSNRSGIGAKVRVRATIAGETFWQLREINSGNGFCGNAIDAHFGLGDAETIDVLRVEWPSGIVQELHGIAGGQFLTVTEPPRLEAVSAGELRLHGWKGQEFRIEASIELQEWIPFQTVASNDSTGIVSITDQNVASFTRRFYRASNRPMPRDWRTAYGIDPGGINNINTSAMEGCPIESPDGRSLFFASNRAGGQGGIDIWMARRDGPNEPWRDPVNLPLVNSAFDDFCPTPLPDGGLFFVSRRPNGCSENSADIYFIPNQGLLGPVVLNCEVNSAGDEFSPSYVPAGGGTGTLFFSSNRDGTHKIYASTRSPDGYFHAPTEVAELNAPGFNTVRPNVSEDGLEIVFDSDRPGGLGGPDIWSATRASASDTWRAPVNPGPSVNSNLAETRASLSRDGRRLTFGSTRPGGQGSSDIYVSSR